MTPELKDVRSAFLQDKGAVPEFDDYAVSVLFAQEKYKITKFYFHFNIIEGDKQVLMNRLPTKIFLIEYMINKYI